ncbi:MAG TPA: glycosyl hydrolase [Bacteroidota bacterium]|nr:glycosyl hydrolase [Bacteroidota bacterium]
MMTDFASPPRSCRLVQAVPSFDDWSGTTDDAIRRKLRFLSDAGAGGIMTTVSLKNYLRDEAAWEVLGRGVRIAHEMGLRVWIYDEEGYPSGSAGGLVLERVPSAEALGLLRVKGEDGAVTYVEQRLYEGTHATENFYKKRHYINILDPAASGAFIEVTHESYERALHPIARYVEAFFTDEPSLIGAYIPKGKEYPKTIPWCRDLPAIFASQKGYDLLPFRESLFVDTGEIDRKIRCDFYDVIAGLCAANYFGRIEKWCRDHGVSSSGHLLGEETLVWQTTFDADPFACYRNFDIPGIDMILSDPGKIMKQLYFLVPNVAGSAARCAGKRRVMCEISDFFGQMEHQSATIEQMQSTAGILFALGVTDLVSMYPAAAVPEKDARPEEFSPAQFRRYTDFTARLNYMFTGGTITSRVAVLHPIRSVWAHFTPSNRSMYEPHPDPLVRYIDGAFTDLCRSLLQHQVDFDIIDEESLRGALIEGGSLVVGSRRYRAVLLPPMDTLRLATMEKCAEFVRQGGAVFAHPLMPRYAAEGPGSDAAMSALVQAMLQAGALGGSTPDAPPLVYLLRSRVPPDCLLEPPTPDILCSEIQRKDGTAYFLVNTSARLYDGMATFRGNGRPSLLDPVTGEEREMISEPRGETGVRARLSLRSFASTFVFFPRA